jgi:hypothetical protein
MKHVILHPLLIAVAAAGLSFNAHAGASSGEVDFGKFAAPGKGGEFVEVQIKSNLLSLAAQLLDKEQPEAAKLLRSVRLVRVNVVGLTDENREEMEKRVTQIRRDLDEKGWERNVNVKSKDGEDVGVYTKTRGGEALEGIAITVVESKNAVFVNLVGDIKPDQVAALGESLNIKPLKDIGSAIKK